MLSVKPISNKLIDYYSNLGFAENHDYYSEDGIRPGRWYGEGAATLGLEGVVSPKVFENVLSGKSPDGKRLLVQQNGTADRKPRAGFDLTYTVPKSVSVLWSQLGHEDRLVLDGICERAVHKALDAYVRLCGVARRGKDGHTLQDAKPVIAVFSHDTARAVPGEAPDPNRHFHAIVANVCTRPDGTTGAVDSRFLFQKRMKMALGAMFRAELAKLLGSELGIEVHRPKQGKKKKVASWFELTGVPGAVIDAMSKRRKEIERWLKAHGLSDTRSAEKAAVATRTAKERHTWKELDAAWSAQGAELGFGIAEAQALLGAAVEQSGEDPRVTALKAVAELEKTKARFTENEVLETAAVMSQTTGTGVDEVLASVSELLTNSEDIVRLKDKHGVKAFTTKAMLEIENRLADTAERLAEVTRHAVGNEITEQVIDEVETVRPQQAKCIRAIAGGADLVAVTGLAGTGKTFALGVARKAHERVGYSVIGTALASKAAKGLEAGSGIKSTHIHQLLHQLDRKEIVISDRTVLVVDEAGMVSTKQLDTLLQKVEAAGAKVVLVGDERQLQAIDAGAPFRLIGERLEGKKVELTEIVRQREEWSRRTVKQFRDGDATTALAEMHTRGRLKISEHRDKAMDELVADWSALLDSKKGTLKDTLIFAGTNLDVEDLNWRAQRDLKKRGQLGEYSVKVLDTDFHLGDRIIVTKNNRLLGLRNGTLGEVVGAWEATLAIETEDGFVVEIDTNEWSELDLAYCLNGYKGQGVTVENAFVLTGDSMTDREMAYVTASRARGLTVVYSDEESVVDITELAEKMSQSNQNEMAIEHLVQEVK